MAPPTAPGAGEGRAADRANALHYGTPDAVDAYLERPYHRLRQRLCRELVQEALGRAFPGLAAAGRRVLELGASSGALARELAAGCGAVVAGDREAAVLGWTRGSAVRGVCLDAERGLPFATGRFHAVVMAELIEHVFDTRSLLGECHRVLADGGVLGLTTPNLATLQDRLRFLLGRAPRQVDPLHEYLYLHIRPFSYRSLTRALAASGFGGFRLRSNHVVLRWGGGRRLESRLLARLWPGLGGSLIVTATKSGAPPARVAGGRPEV